MKREYRANPETIEIREENGGFKIRGYAAVFNQLSEPIMGLFRERILPGAFRKSLQNDVRALVNHHASEIIGRTKNGTLTLREDDHGLYVEIRPPNTTAGRDVVENIRGGYLDQMSFGFSVDEDGQKWSKTDKGERLRDLTDVDVFDVSVVAFPAYTKTSVSVRALWPDGVPDDIEKLRLAAPPVVVIPSAAVVAVQSGPSHARKIVEELEAKFGLKKA